MDLLIDAHGQFPTPDLSAIADASSVILIRKGTLLPYPTAEDMNMGTPEPIITSSPAMAQGASSLASRAAG